MADTQIHSVESFSDQSEISQLDSQHIFHPCFQLAAHPPAIPLVKGEGASLFDENGKEYLDLISSWWVNIHGHAHPKIASAIAEQAHTLDQVIFTSFTHSPAVTLAKKLTHFHPKTPRVFFTDNGSSACEAALKMAFQYWQNKGDMNRKRFLSFENDYHGETLGAMSVSGASVYLKPYEKLMFNIDRLPFPATWWGDEDVELKEQKSLNDLDNYLEDHASEVAAFILEPLVQGSGGMHMCRPSFLKAVIEKVQAAGILVIVDEVMTGLGRTGEMFASWKAGIQPDLICLSKGLTGGLLPLAATLCREDIFQSFLHGGIAKAFGHSHSYTANPITCAAALASLELFKEEKTIDKIKRIETWHLQHLQSLQNELPQTEKYRVMGDIAAFDLKAKDAGYTSSIGQELRLFFHEKGCLLRPLGNTIYLMPPYCISEEELSRGYNVIKSACKNFS